jgi:hypothetical protein
LSSQGTGSGALSTGFYYVMLESWGAWARTGDGGLGYGKSGYAPTELFSKNGATIMYSDEEMGQVDKAVCELPEHDRRVLKKVFIHKDTRGVEYEELGGCVAAFAESFEGHGADRAEAAD